MWNSVRADGVKLEQDWNWNSTQAHKEAKGLDRLSTDRRTLQTMSHRLTPLSAPIVYSIVLRQWT